MRTIRDQLVEKGLTVSLSGKKAAPNIQTSKRPKESLSLREWAEIMGSNRDTFRRAKGGAIRRNR